MSPTREHLAPGEKPVRLRLAQLSVLGWAHFLNDGAANYLPGILPAILHMLKLPVALAGALVGAMLVGQVAQPLFGWLADRFGGRGFVLLGLGGTALGAALVGIAPGALSLIGVLFLIGVATSVFHPQALAAVRTLTTRKTGLVMSAFLVGGELGRGIWPILASLVVVGLGLKAIWLLSIPALFTLPLVAFSAPRLPARPSHHRAAWRHHRKDFALVIAYSTTRAVLWFSLVTFVPLLWHARGGSLVGGASLITTFFVVGIVGNLGGGHFSDVFGRRKVLAAASLLSALLLALFLLVGGIGLWLVLAALGIVVFATLPIVILMGQDVVPENPSLGSGLALGFSNGLGAVIVALLGLLTIRWSIEAVLWLNVALALVSAALVPYLPAQSRRAHGA